MVVEGITELVEIVLHYILYVRDVYPKAAFEKRQKYNLPIWKCLHPGVCSYIHKFMELATELLERQRKLDVVFTILGALGQRFEEFVFEIQVMDSNMIDETLTRYCETTLSNICFNINTCDSLKLYSGACTFSSHIRLNPEPVPISRLRGTLKNKNFSWITFRRSKSEPWKRMIPLKTVENPSYGLQIYIYQK
ncbi:Mitotic spindle assembly checkpoint protein MAD2B, partial [Stegodyphus mimosarum]